MSCLLCIETAIPDHAHRQEQLAEYYAGTAPPEDRALHRQISAVARRSGIAQRHSVLPDFRDESDAVLFHRGNGMPGLRARMNVFRREALALSLRSVRAIRDFETIRNDITHLITVTCTGLFAPGLDIELMRELGLRRTVHRSSVNFMGCNAALLALRQARQVCDANAGALVLVVCTELCTLHFQRSYSEDDVLSNMLFADGSAAALVGAPNTTLAAHYRPLQAGSFHSLVVYEGFNDMAWELSETGFVMNLSAYVPRLLSANIDALFSENSISRSDIVHWAIHPGGRKILDDFCRSMSLDPEALTSSYKVLNDYGNMSSATILFVLQRLAKDRPIADGEKVFAAAFGPGLTIESAILQYV